MSPPNPLLLAADKPAQVLTLLRQQPALASVQDEHGYSLLHAAASYSHVELLRSLLSEFHVDVNLKDEDGETALFVCETQECAKILVEEFYIDTSVRGEEGMTAREKIVAEEEFPEVAVYLMVNEFGSVEGANGTNGSATDIIGRPPPLPEGVKIDIGTMSEADIGTNAPDPEFRRRIEELAARPDFEGDEAQMELRQLVAEALGSQNEEERNVRQRRD